MSSSDNANAYQPKTSAGYVSELKSYYDNRQFSTWLTLEIMIKLIDNCRKVKISD